MSKSLLSYIDDNYPPTTEIIKVGALTTIMQTVITTQGFERNPELREEGKWAATQMLEVIGRSRHTEDEEYINGQRVYAQLALARFVEEEETKEGYEMALEYWRDARDYYKSRGDAFSVRGAESSIDRLEAKRDGRPEGLPSEQLLKDLRHEYLKSVKGKGEESSDTVRSGIVLIMALARGENSFECERFCVKLYAISRRVHGPDHDLTGRIESSLRQSRVRRLAKVTGDGPVDYQVLQVRGNEKKYVVMSRREGDVSEILFDDDYMIMPGTPVVCHGLKNAQHLNGKLGDVRSFDTATKRYVVRFEDKALNKASVKAVNLRIVMDLPAHS
ncbi:hypothetical protein ACHAXT_010860 [Thalassiosira profunda]